MWRESHGSLESELNQIYETIVKLANRLWGGSVGVYLAAYTLV